MIELKGIKKAFGNNEVLKGVDLTIEKGEIISILGASGSGKSTLLRTMNFLEKADEGQMIFNDKKYDMSKVTEKEKHSIRRKTSMVFQNYNLFKNKTALENITEGLVVGGTHKMEEAIEIGERLLKKVGLSEKRGSYPSQLSGGQQQRIGIARALAVNPEVILLDEPTSSLDPELVADVLEVIRDLAKENISLVIVTHEMEFAKEISDTIVFLDEGRILESGSPDSIFNKSKILRIQEFLKRTKNSNK